MASSLRGRDLLDIKSLSVAEVARILETAQKLKKRPFGSALKDKTVVMLFAKPSTRTRVSFEVAINQQAGDDIYLETQQTQLSRGESVQDTAKVLSRYCDAIVARLFAHSDLLELAQHAEVPVVNGLTDLHHPCQVLSDLFTLVEKGRKLPGLKLAFFGDGGS
ncbi:MAG TPA: ornithine carbamoyltransferase, partial [archaeon]|nr:ornithine carbamoyltransferase [archaeon]